MKLPLINPYVTKKGSQAIVGLLGASLVLNGILWWLIWQFFPVNDPATILHYSIDTGVDFIGEGKQITSLPILGLLIIGFNTVIGVALLRADQRASWILWSTMPLIQLILLVAFYLLWRVNL